LAWFRRRSNQPWATTPFTEAGFVRVSANVSAIPAAVTPSEALALLERMRDVFEHRFLPDDVPLVVGAYLGTERVASYRHVTDAHLLAVARRHGAQLATLDRGIAALAGGQDVVVVPLA
jgi:toxin-antitoxin system PIN domain toxin